MQTPRKKFDLWPLIVGTIAAIGIIGSNSTGGITKTTREPTPSPAVTATAPTAAGPSASMPTTAAATGPASPTSPAGPTGPTVATGAQAIRIAGLTAAVKAGELAGISIVGQPGVTYDIVVTFGKESGGVSGMEPKQADAEGRVAWQWRVPILSPRGTYAIRITGGGQQLMSSFTVN